MLRTTYLNLKKPEGSDPVNVQDFNDNADTIDTEVNARVKSSGGDIANTKVSAFTASTESYPVPAAGETTKVFMGKIKKFFEDFKSLKDSIVTKTMIINQILNDSTKAASAATVYSVNEKVDSAISDLNEGKYFRAYTSAFVFGKSIAANSKDNTFDFNISARGFATKPGIFILVPAVAKLTNIRYDYDNSTAQVAKIIFDNEGALISADTYVRVGVIAIE